MSISRKGGSEEDSVKVDGVVDIRPEDAIPDLPENIGAREFLKKAPTKGLWLPLGVEVKVMQCFRCKAYGHRTGDKECPLSQHGNIILDAERQAREDPMAIFVAKKNDSRKEKYQRAAQLMIIMDEIRKEEKQRKREKKVKKHSRKDKHEDREGKRRRE